MRLPHWLTKKVPSPEAMEKMRQLLNSLSLNTVCQEAHCPNIGECFSCGTATFMILGKKCTRNCHFCAVTTGDPLPPDPREPARVAEAVDQLDLTYVVVTSVTRDDLPDGGAKHFSETIRWIKKRRRNSTLVEVLIPDFCGSISSLRKVIQAHPLVVNHNLETVPELYPRVRPEADYQRSIKLLESCKELNPHIYTKSGLMVGLGEEKGQVVQVMKDLRRARCDILTIGQYLRPSPTHLPVDKFICPDVFAWYKEVACSLGFVYVASSPFVRSSYMAREWLTSLK